MYIHGLTGRVFSRMSHDLVRHKGAKTESKNISRQGGERNELSDTIVNFLFFNAAKTFSIFKWINYLPFEPAFILNSSVQKIKSGTEQKGPYIEYTKQRKARCHTGMAEGHRVTIIKSKIFINFCPAIPSSRTIDLWHWRYNDPRCHFSQGGYKRRIAGAQKQKLMEE